MASSIFYPCQGAFIDGGGQRCSEGCIVMAGESRWRRRKGGGRKRVAARLQQQKQRTRGLVYPDPEWKFLAHRRRRRRRKTTLSRTVAPFRKRLLPFWRRRGGGKETLSLSLSLCARRDHRSHFFPMLRFGLAHFAHVSPDRSFCEIVGSKEKRQQQMSRRGVKSGRPSPLMVWLRRDSVQFY